MSNYQQTPLQSKIRTYAMIFLALAFVVTLYAAFAVKTSLESLADSLPVLAVLPQVREIDLSALSTLRILTIFAAIVYGCAAVVLYLKRNISTNTVLSVAVIVSVLLTVIAITKLKAFSFPVSYSYDDGGYHTSVQGGMFLPSTLLPYAVITVTTFVTALLAAFNARLTKRALRTIEAADRPSGEFGKARIARVSAVVMSIIALAAAIVIFIWISDNAETVAYVKEYYNR